MTFSPNSSIVGNPGKGDWVPPPRVSEHRYNQQFTHGLRDRNKFETDQEYVFSEGLYNPDTVSYIYSYWVLFDKNLRTDQKKRF